MRTIHTSVPGRMDVRMVHMILGFYIILQNRPCRNGENHPENTQQRR